MDAGEVFVAIAAEEGNFRIRREPVTKGRVITVGADYELAGLTNGLLQQRNRPGENFEALVGEDCSEKTEPQRAGRLWIPRATVKVRVAACNAMQCIKMGLAIWDKLALGGIKAHSDQDIGDISARPDDAVRAGEILQPGDTAIPVVAYNP